MAELSLVRDDDAIGFSNKPVVLPTLPPFAVDVDSLISTLIQKAADLEILVEGKVTKGEVKTEIAFGSELIKIQADEIAVVGNFTVIDILNEQNGTTTGLISTTITRIIGDLIQTGAIISNNFSPSAGTAIDLDDATIIMGGSSSPKFNFDGVNLFIKGTVQAGSLIAVGISSDDISNAISDPTDGIVIDSAGLRGFDGGVQTFEIPSDGSPTLFEGDIVTSGQFFTDGSTTDAGDTAAILSKPTTSITAILGVRNTGAASAIIGDGNLVGVGLAGLATTGTGVQGAATSAGGECFLCQDGSAGDSIQLGTLGNILGDADFEDDVNIQGTLDVDGIATFNTTANFAAGVNLTGTANLTVDRSCNFATDENSGDSSVVIGNKSATGKNTLVIAEGTIGSAVNGQMHFYGENDVTFGTILGIVAEQAAPNSTGSFSITKGIPVQYQGALLFLGASAVL